MKENYQIELSEVVKGEDEDLLFDGLNADAMKAKGMLPIRNFGAMIKDQTGNTFGGVEGFTLYGCLYIDMIWIDEKLRHQGWGSRLMNASEKIGRERGCSFATVNTMDWEALTFYQKLGYEIEFIRTGYDKDSKMYLLRKPL